MHNFHLIGAKTWHNLCQGLRVFLAFLTQQRSSYALPPSMKAHKAIYFIDWISNHVQRLFWSCALYSNIPMKPFDSFVIPILHSRGFQHWHDIVQLANFSQIIVWSELIFNNRWTLVPGLQSRGKFLQELIQTDCYVVIHRAFCWQVRRHTTC